MRVDDLKRLYAYHYWANGKLFGVVAQLTEEEFTRQVAGSYGSVRNTLVHTLSAEWGWLDRCGGQPRGARLHPGDYPTVESLVQAATRVEGYVNTFLSRLEDKDLERRIDFTFSPGQTHTKTVGHLMQHAANHAVHHRGQVALLLRMIGHTPGDFDLLYYDERR